MIDCDNLIMQAKSQNEDRKERYYLPNPSHSKTVSHNFIPLLFLKIQLTENYDLSIIKLSTELFTYKKLRQKYLLLSYHFV